MVTADVVVAWEPNIVEKEIEIPDKENLIASFEDISRLLITVMFALE